MAKAKEQDQRRGKRAPFTSYADAIATAGTEGYRIVEEIRTRGSIRLNVVKGKRPETWRVEQS